MLKILFFENATFAVSHERLHQLRSFKTFQLPCTSLITSKGRVLLELKLPDPVIPWFVGYGTPHMGEKA